MQEKQGDDQFTIDEGTEALVPPGPRVILVVSVERHDHTVPPMRDRALVEIARATPRNPRKKTPAASRSMAR